MSRELKNYELRSCRRPILSGRYRLVSNTVHVCMASDKQYYCYVSFSDKLVEKVGKKLPRGVSEFDPAYLRVYLDEDRYYVQAVSHRSRASVVLFAGGLPCSWLKTYPIGGR